MPFQNADSEFLENNKRMNALRRRSLCFLPASDRKDLVELDNSWFNHCVPRTPNFVGQPSRSNGQEENEKERRANEQSPEQRVFRNLNFRQHSRTLPSECLANVSAPKMYMSSSPFVPSECLDNVCAFSMYQSGAPSARSNECPDNGSAPSMYQSRVSSQSQIDHISAPSFYDVSAPSRHRHRLDNVSTPSMYQSGAPSARSRTLPSECVDNGSAPSQSGIDYISAPSFCDVSAPYRPRDVSVRPVDHSRISSENKCYPISGHHLYSTPNSASTRSFFDALYCEVLRRFSELKKRVFGTSNTAALPYHLTNIGSNNLNLQRPLCGTSARKITSRQIKGDGCEGIYETVIESVAINNGKLFKTIKRITTKRDRCGNIISQTKEHKNILDGRNSTQLEQINPDSGIANRSHKDSAAASNSLCGPTRRRLNSLAPQLSPPPRDFQSLKSSFFHPECLDHVSMPSINNYVSSPRRSYRSERLDNISAHSYGKTLSQDSRGRYASIPSECIDQISMPFFNQYPALPKRPSRKSIERDYPRQSSKAQYQSVPNQQIADNSPPSFASRGPAQGFSRPCEHLIQESMPSFNESSKKYSCQLNDRIEETAFDPNLSRGTLGIQSRSLPCRNISQTTNLTSQPFRRLLFPNQCFSDVGKEIFQRRGNHNIPSQHIYDESEPLYYSAPTSRRFPVERLDDISAPSYGSGFLRNGSSRRDHTMPNQQISDESQPSFYSSMPSARNYSCPNENLADMTMPSFNDNVAFPPQRRPHTLPSDYLENACAPSSSGRSTSRRPLTMPSECLDGISAPFGEMYPSSCPCGMGGRSMPSGFIDDISASTFNTTCASSIRYNLPSEGLDDVSQPRLEDTQISVEHELAYKYERKVGKPVENVEDISLTINCTPTDENITEGTPINSSVTKMPLRKEQISPGGSLHDAITYNTTTEPSESTRNVTQPSESLDLKSLPNSDNFTKDISGHHQDGAQPADTTNDPFQQERKNILPNENHDGTSLLSAKDSTSEINRNVSSPIFHSTNNTTGHQDGASATKLNSTDEQSGKEQNRTITSEHTSEGASAPTLSSTKDLPTEQNRDTGIPPKSNSTDDPQRNRNPRLEYREETSASPMLNISNISPSSHMGTLGSSLNNRLPPLARERSEHICPPPYSSSMYPANQSSRQLEKYPYKAFAPTEVKFFTPLPPKKNPCSQHRGYCDRRSVRKHPGYKYNNSRSYCCNYSDDYSSECYLREPCSYHYCDYNSDSSDDPSPCSRFNIYCDESSTDYCPQH